MKGWWYKRKYGIKRNGGYSRAIHKDECCQNISKILLRKTGTGKKNKVKRDQSGRKIRKNGGIKQN